jgi:hypothetical protein
MMTVTLIALDTCVGQLRFNATTRWALKLGSYGTYIDLEDFRSAIAAMSEYCSAPGNKQERGSRLRVKDGTVLQACRHWTRGFGWRDGNKLQM